TVGFLAITRTRPDPASAGHGQAEQGVAEVRGRSGQGSRRSAPPGCAGASTTGRVFRGCPGGERGRFAAANRAERTGLSGGVRPTAWARPVAGIARTLPGRRRAD